MNKYEKADRAHDLVERVEKERGRQLTLEEVEELMDDFRKTIEKEAKAAGGEE